MKRFTTALLAALLLAQAAPALAADTTRPTVGLPSPTAATAGVALTISATVSDNEAGVSTCRLYVDNDDVAGMDISGNTASVSYAFLQAGIHTMFVFCRDAANNFNSGANASVTVTASSGSGDSTPPEVGTASPVTAVAAVPVTVSAAVSDAGTGLSNCQLLIDGFSKGTMTIAGGMASKIATFDAAGSYNVSVQCADIAGNTRTGQTAIVNVTATPPVSEVPNVQPKLVKLACPAGAGTDHPCKAVYYRGLDGKRHAFPNSRVFFTWYQDFSTVEELPLGELSSLPLGKSVTYRPGSKLVKFTTLNNVYAVAKGGKLRWIKSEAVASALYGSDWNKKIDDISDVFFLDYAFGADVNAASDFSVTGETAGTSTIDQNF